MKVLARSQLKRAKIDADEASRFARFVMGRVDCAKDAELSSLFAGRHAMRRLNREYRGVDRATDVLAFPLGDRRGANRPSGALGDVAISVDHARQCARLYRTTVNAELLLYITHGILHLCGFDDHSAVARKGMAQRQEELVRLALRRRAWNVIG